MWSPEETADLKFADAPLIHPWNAPKYDAAIVRAQDYARRAQKVLLWCVAEDRPLSLEHRTLSDEELNEKRETWVTYHDKKTGGVMGFLPMVQDMPLSVTVTEQKNKKVMFKNRRCRLFGWTYVWEWV